MRLVWAGAGTHEPRPRSTVTQYVTGFITESTNREVLAGLGIIERGGHRTRTYYRRAFAKHVRGACERTDNNESLACRKKF